MKWFVQVRDQSDRILFAMPAPSWKETDELANTAIEQRHDVRAFVRAPTGNVREYWWEEQ